MSIHSLGGAIVNSLGTSLVAHMSSRGLSLKPVQSGRITSLLQTMVPSGYAKLQEERLAMADLGGKADGHQNGFRQDPPHLESRRHSDRGCGRASASPVDNGDCCYSETDTLLCEGRLSGEEEEEGEEEGEGRLEEDEEQGGTARRMPKESPLAMALQILLPFLLAGFGTVSAGMVLDIVQHWEAFKNITEIFILVNVGKMDSPIEKWNLIIGNLALKQVQATVVGFLAAVAAVRPEEVLASIEFNTLAVSTFCPPSGIIMVGVIVGSKKTGINPDNVATPIAASFGDLITLAILAWISQGLYICLDSHPYVSSLVCAFFLCLTPVCIVISSKHPASRTLLYSGWEPVITAMVISSIGGLILDKTVSDPNLAGIVVYTPVINGIGGNLVAIQASRISTYLHFHSAPGEIPEEAKGCYYPCRTFCGSGANHRSAQVLLLLVVPGHLIFLYTIHLMKSGHTTLTPIFMTVYLAAALLQFFIYSF
ncbi:hypothetical protein JZ751_022231 [Albula glossodonta]|uniref:Solute carrier family 41 member n=1 Tax=Albula glossodonta TaxID=121402 RepID=A0A8T2NQS6_9TELE|nr:hypothetical protein JZ751_022231 [Albula glossodonta]